MKMNHIKQQLIIDLLKGLHQANMADVTDGDHINDLPSDCVNQSSLYGHLSDALDTLGWMGQEAREIYTDHGDISDAVSFVNEQYELLKQAGF
jgi:hypothetical protein